MTFGGSELALADDGTSADDREVSARGQLLRWKAAVVAVALA
jgi:hypothetical protein